MDFIFEIIIESLVIWICSYPGAFIRWGFTGFKKGKFEEFAKKDPYINFGCFILFLVPIIIGIRLL